MLFEASQDTPPFATNAPGSRYFAPLLGTCNQAGVDHLLWEACPGADLTLLTYLETPGQLPALARALGVVEHGRPLSAAEHSLLCRTVLRDMLSALAVVELAGVVHRDVKPANWLVDRNRRTLRLIDLGAACVLAEDCAMGPSTSAYAPPEQSMGQMGEVRASYDAFSAALVWLQVLFGARGREVPALREALRNAHDFEIEAAAFLPKVGDAELCRVIQAGVGVSAGGGCDAWAHGASFFARGEEGRLAWRLLRAMTHADPRERVAAADARADEYLSLWQSVPAER